MKSSWSSPNCPWPLGASTPTIRNGMLFTRSTWPTGSCSGKSVRATVAPRMATLSATRTSRADRLAPDAMGQLRMTTYSSFPPSMLVFQFWLPATTCTRVRAPGEMRATVGSCAITCASSRFSVLMLPAPPRTAPPPRPKLPLET